MMLLWLNVLALPAFGLATGRWGLVSALGNGAAVVVLAALGSWSGASPKLRSIAASLGLLTAAALFVEAAGGRIEAHFYFFVLVIVLTLYEDWTPFLVAVGFILIHHGVIGMLDPRAVFDRPEEWAHPWVWASIHAAFIAAAGIASIGAWRLNENVRANMRSAYQRVEELSETERHPELGAHGNAVRSLADLVARRLGLPDDVLDQVRNAAELHDIGKVAIPDQVINKPGPLDEYEWDFIRQHTIIGERILRAAPALAPVASMVRSSHERFDGTGYPDRLAGEGIPIGARIIFACDAFDAMTSDRAYARAKTQTEALAELERCAGTQFDPTAVAALAAVLAPEAADPSERFALAA
jgi:HD domain